jgi:YHS domain-containing protein
MEGEEFSGDFEREKLLSGEDEWDQLVGQRRRTEESLLVIKATKEEILKGEAIMTTDPVCGMRVNEKESEFHTQFAGRKYFFCSDDCRKEFEAEPDAYVETAAA